MQEPRGRNEFCMLEELKKGRVAECGEGGRGAQAENVEINSAITQ